ncbi:MAG: twin-arginine translocase subunit TatC [Victivallales bacterium]|nr:twin-arginine translocase subunit TatC [Victivallales bacterium]
MEKEETLVSHLEALRKALLRIIAITAIIYPLGYVLCPLVIEFLIKWSCPPEMGGLHYFAPMEVLFVKLKLALVLALVIAYPWNILQIWEFILPALYKNERRALGWWLFSSSILFVTGVAFCVAFILPLLMSFSSDFASVELKPIIGLSGFLNLSGWLMLAFGLMFQVPILVLLAVRFGAVSHESLRMKRPYVMVFILFAAALLTPPDVVSQVMLAVPTWLLFELGLLISKRMEKKQDEQT